MTEVRDTIVALLHRLEGPGAVWLRTTHNRLVRPDVHPATLRTAKLQGLVRELGRRGPPHPAVEVRLTPKGRRLLGTLAAAGR